MALAPLVRGSDCDLTIASKSYADCVASYTLSTETATVEYQTLGGPRADSGSETGTLEITFAYDSGGTDSLFDALWDAAVSTAPGGNKIAYVAKAGSSQFTGSAVAVRPPVAPVAGEVVECSVTLALDGMPTKAAAA